MVDGMPTVERLGNNLLVSTSQGKILVVGFLASQYAADFGDKIVTACNCHDDLVTALEEIATLGEQEMKPDYNEWLTFHDKVAQTARAALAKAKEQSQ